MTQTKYLQSDLKIVLNVKTRIVISLFNPLDVKLIFAKLL